MVEGGWKDRGQDAALAFADYWNDAFPLPQHQARYPAALAEAIEPFQKPGDMALIARPVDWFGLNHYSPHYIRADAGNVIGASFGPVPAGGDRSRSGCPRLFRVVSARQFRVDRRLFAAFRPRLYRLRHAAADSQSLRAVVLGPHRGYEADAGRNRQTDDRPRRG